MRIQSKKTWSKKKAAIVALLIVVVGAGTYSAYVYFHKDDIKRDDKGVSVERTPQDVKLEEELNKDPAKKEQTSQTDHPATPEVNNQTGLQNASVVLTNTGETNGEVSASGFVSNVVEESGTCKYIFTKGDATVEKTSTTLPNANSTTCKTVHFDKSELGVGVWKTALEYNSSTSSGRSNELEVTIK